MSIIKCLDGYEVNIENVSKYEVIQKASYPPHWGWAVFWIILFWPVALIWMSIAMIRKKHQILFYYKYGMMERVWVRSDELRNLESLSSQYGIGGNVNGRTSVSG